MTQAEDTREITGPDGYTAHVRGEAIYVRRNHRTVASGRVVQSIDDSLLIPMGTADLVAIKVKPPIPRYVREAIEERLTSELQR